MCKPENTSVTEAHHDVMRLILAMLAHCSQDSVQELQITQI